MVAIFYRHTTKKIQSVSVLARRVNYRQFRREIVGTCAPKQTNFTGTQAWFSIDQILFTPWHCVKLYNVDLKLFFFLVIHVLFKIINFL